MKVREFETSMQSPTPYPDVNALLRDLLADAQAILKDNFVGMYLHGSLASGDFDPQRSDIDFVIVTADKLSAEMVSALEALHARMTASGAKWAAKLEGTYIPQDALRRYNPEDGPFPCINEGKFYMARHESHWVLTRHILREQGVVIAGPEPRTLIEPVHPDDLRRAVKEFLREWWSPMMEMPARLQSSEYQTYAVLTMCRALYTFENGTIASKPVCARWAQEEFGAEWSALIEWALKWKKDTTSDKMSEALSFIRYAVNYSPKTSEAFAKHLRRGPRLRKSERRRNSERMELINQPSPYPEANAILGELLTSVQSILGDHFIGMYLYGSLATGDFDRESDVDYVIVTDDVLSDDLFSELQAMHTRIATLDSWCATQLEGSYVPQDALRQYDPVHALHLHIDRGRGEQLKKMKLDSALLSRAWWGGWVLLRESLREKGITLAGPAPRTLIDPVSPEKLRQAALAILHGWAAQILNAPPEIDSRGYQSYTVLTLCRILYTLQHGAVAAKSVAAKWVQETLDERWKPLIDRAWVGRQNPGLKAQADDMNKTLEFIRYTLERSQQFIQPNGDAL